MRLITPMNCSLRFIAISSHRRGKITAKRSKGNETGQNNGQVEKEKPSLGISLIPFCISRGHLTSAYAPHVLNDSVPGSWPARVTIRFKAKSGNVRERGQIRTFADFVSRSNVNCFILQLTPAPRFSPTRSMPTVARARPILELDCLQTLG
jgi:hypothetical protein